MIDGRYLDILTSDGGHMGYRVTLPGMFAVPNSVADEHLKLAKELHLKVLLWLLRHDGEAEGLGALAQWLGKPEGDLVDALQFWIDRKIISINNEQLTMSNENERAVQSPQVIQKPPAPPPLPPILPPVRPTAGQILARLEEDPNLRELYRAAEEVLGRTIGYEGHCMLLQLHDTHGLPAEVIYMLLRCCADAGKTNNGYIEAMGRDWGQREIDTIEKADEQIALLKESRSLWGELRRLSGIHAPRPTAAQTEYLRRWHRELSYGIDMIFAAYEEMANHTGKLSFSYMNKILEGWHAQGIRTPEQAAAANAAYQAGRQAKGEPQKPGKKTAERSETGPSYNLDEYERSTLQVPVFGKKE